MNKIKVAVFFGGDSSEHEVSRLSVTSVIKTLNKDKYDIVSVGIKKDGSWWLFNGDVDTIANGDWENCPTNKPCMLSADSKNSGIMIIGETDTIKVDVLFPVLHGKNGEDGTIQGIFEMSKIPYVGCPVLASSCCMDKAVTNILLENAKINQAKFVWFYAMDFFKDESYRDEIVSECEEKLKYPMFVKPANAGSSVGISKAANQVELINAFETAAKEDNRIVVEECVIGRELECAVMGNLSPKASVVGEIVPCNEFYDYEAKYLAGESKTQIPANISEEISNQIRECAKKAYKALGCLGLSRVDFFLRESDNAILLNEINTLPGFTSISMYSMLWGETGVAFVDLLDELIGYAMEDKRNIFMKKEALKKAQEV